MRRLARKVLAWLHRELVPPDPFESAADLDAYFSAMPVGGEREAADLRGTAYEEAYKARFN